MAFGALAALTALLGYHAVGSVVEAGRLVVDIYDKPLMAISYARLAQSNFTSIKLVSVQYQAAADAEQRRRWRDRVHHLSQALRDDLMVAEERSMSVKGAALAHDARSAFDRWSAAWDVHSAKDQVTANDALEHQAAVIDEALDSLAEQMADDGFKHRQRALAAIESYHFLNVAATLGAIVVLGLIALLLARRMVHPIAAASHAAARIAEGELDVPIEPAGRDELGRLLEAMAVMRDKIRDMVRREVAARQSAQARLVNAIESSGDGVILVDASGRILLTNSQIIDFYPALADALVAGSLLPVEIETALAGPTGEVQLADGRWLRLSRGANSDGGLIIFASDITVLMQRESALRAAKEEAEAASRSKSEFLANMSHELRTPLNAVLGFSEVIRDALMGPVSGRYQNYAHDIHNAGSHLLNLITEVLDLAKIDAGRLELHEERVNVAETIESCHRIIRPRAVEAKIDLAFEIATDLPLVHADDLRLKQIILNLLSNAVKFTPSHGCVTVSASRLRSGEVTISVADTGIGMRAQEIPIALEPFRQIDSALNRRYAGTGLGLPLVHRLVALHGGVLDIRSEPGAGTTVNVTLPAERCLMNVA